MPNEGVVVSTESINIEPHWPGVANWLVRAAKSSIPQLRNATVVEVAFMSGDAGTYLLTKSGSVWKMDDSPEQWHKMKNDFRWEAIADNSYWVGLVQGV
jgi:hypothetical protein